MKRNNMIMYLLILLYSAFSMASCDVHEFPDVPDTPPVYTGKLPYVLNLDCNTELPFHKEVIYTTRSTDAEEEHDMRYIVNVYRSDNARDFNRVADTTIVFTKSLDEERSHSLQLNLEQGLYNFIVWSDHVDKGTDCDKYYNTADFAEIIYADRKNYEGNNDFQDAFRGSEQDSVVYRTDVNGEIIRQEVTVQMSRPFAKFQFIATDLAEFVTRVTEERAASGDETTRSVNPEDYRLLFRYTGYMPCSYNMFTNRPADAWTGMSFEGRPTPIDEHEVDLGFDYVFVNGTETHISVALEMYDKQGELVSSTRTIDVPIVRNKLTIVRGKFLTSKVTTGNMGINPDYEDDYNIEIK